MYHFSSPFLSYYIINSSFSSSLLSLANYNKLFYPINFIIFYLPSSITIYFILFFLSIYHICFPSFSYYVFNSSFFQFFFVFWVIQSGVTKKNQMPLSVGVGKLKMVVMVLDDDYDDEGGGAWDICPS